MKNKKNIYILAPAVVLVWGLLIYKIVAGLNPSVDTTPTSETIVEFKPKSFKQAESFTIAADYRDPFLGTFKKKTKKRSRVKPTPEKPTTPFPNVVFKGIISPKGKNEKVFLIQVNGNQYLFKQNAVFNEVKLLKGNATEVTMQFEKQVQTFQLKK